MDLEQRLRTGDGLEPVSETEVIRYWLREELDDGDSDETDSGDSLDPDAVETEPGLREELLERKPIASRAFAAEPADWYHADLSEAELRDLRVVVGPRGEDWRALAEDNRVGTIAERIHAAATDGGPADETGDGTTSETDDGTTTGTDDGTADETEDEATSVAELDEETPKDLREVVEMADAIDPEGPVSRLVVVKEGDDTAYVADGNHRAVAHVLYLLRGGAFTGQEAYLGVRE